MSDGGHHHRSSLKQTSKPFKGFSKGAAKRATRGRVEERITVGSKRVTVDGQKQRRLDHANDTQRRKVLEAAQRKRLGSRHGAPRIVGVVALSPTLEVGKLAQLLRNECTPCDNSANSLPFIQTMRAQVENKDARFTFVLTPRDPIAVADVAKVADVVLFVMNPTAADGEDLGVDVLGNHFMQIIKAQGLPHVIGVTTGISSAEANAGANGSTRRKQTVARLAERFFHTVFNDEVKVVNCDSPAETKALLRLAHNSPAAALTWRVERARMLGEHVAYVPNENSPLAQSAAALAAEGGDDITPLFEMNADKGQLRVTGYLRGERTLCANQLVHITGFGDFPLIQIEGAADANAPGWVKGANRKGTAPGAAAMEAAAVLSRANEERETFQDMLPAAAATLGNDFGDDITADELAAAVAQNPDLAATSSMFKVAGDGSVQVQRLGPERPLFTDWRSQETATVQSFSSITAEQAAVAAAAPRFTQDTITQVRNQEIGSETLKSVWDDIKLSDDEADDAAAGSGAQGMGDSDDEAGTQGKKGGFSEVNADLSRGLGRLTSPNARFRAPQADDDDELAPHADVSDFEEDGEEGEFDPTQANAERRNLRRTARREDMAEQGINDYDDTASQLSAFSAFSMGSLRAPGESSAEVAAKFSQLAWSEKVRRLCKYGRKGEDKLARLKKRMEREATDFRDEVEWDRKITARARFALYRPLRSFRQSAWDHHESLPAEYGRILQFANFTIAERNAKDACALENISSRVTEEEDGRLMDDGEDDAADAYDDDEDPSGRAIAPERATQVTLVIANVPADAAKMVMAGQALALVWGLFRHEHKVSVMHVQLKRHNEYDQPIRNKDPMHFQVGFRRFLTAPIFSEQCKGTTKLLMQRFVPQDVNFVASFYARVMFPSATVLMFPAHVLGSYKDEFPFNPLAASGTLLTCDPNRLVLKRAVLTGYPVKASYNTAVVKHMFSTPSDVQWFKPVELWTKTGLYGRITDSRGLHGLFKASFSNVMKHKKPVHMTLYKRQFPVWNPSTLG